MELRAPPGWRGAGLWLILVLAALAATAALVADIPTWVIVVFLLIGAAPLLASLGISLWVNSGRYSPAESPTYWQDWLMGWYWETDAEHRLVLVKPDGASAEHWQAARQLMQRHAPWWACWQEDPAAASRPVGLTMLEMRLKARLALDVADLPGPLQGEARGGECWHIVGAPRFSADGRFLGHHGVWRPPTVMQHQAQVHEDDQAGQDTTQLSDSDQEVLRYALSHDLRAPLRVVDGFSRIIKEDYGRLLDRIGNDHLDRVLAAAARMNGMIDAILAQAQLSHVPLQRTRIDVSAMAREVFLEQRAARHADLVPMGQPALLDVEFNVADGLVVDGDPVLVRRVFENLIGNALKYSGKVAHPCIEVGVVPGSAPRVFLVRDNGAGFDMQHADKLFGLFQRLHSSRDFPGTGVGLAGVQNIVRRHGGRVWAEAAPGQGACFFFTLQSGAA